MYEWFKNQRQRSKKIIWYFLNQMIYFCLYAERKIGHITNVKATLIFFTAVMNVKIPSVIFNDFYS